MKYEIGDVIKSMDFPNRTDCYMIGVIESVDTNIMQLGLRTVEIVSLGKNLDVSDGDQFFTFYSPGLLENMYKEPRLQVLLDPAMAC